MAQLIKGSPEWIEAKKDARAQLDAKLAFGLPHGGKNLPLIRVAAAIGEPPKPPKPARKRKTSKPKPPKPTE